MERFGWGFADLPKIATVSGMAKAGNAKTVEITANPGALRSRVVIMIVSLLAWISTTRHSLTFRRFSALSDETERAAIPPRDGDRFALHLRMTAPPSLAPGTTAHPGYRSMPKNATIPASLGLMEESRCSNTLQGKGRPSCAKGSQAQG